MSTKRETVLTALETLLTTTFATSGAAFDRDPEKAPPDNDGGNVIMRDGDPGPPTVSLSPVQYEFDHKVFVEVSASGTNRNAVVDALLVILNAALASNRTLSGAAIDCRVMDAPVIDEVDAGEGAETIRAATVDVNLSYVTDSPIG